MLYDGQFCRAAGLVYPDLWDCITDIKEIPVGRIVGGLDFGFNDPFAALAGVLDADDCLWLFYERYIREKTLEEHAPHLPKSAAWYCDSARPDSIRSLKKLGFQARPCKKGTGSIEEGINLVHQRIRRGGLKIVRLNEKVLCPQLLAEAETYHYPTKDEESTGDKPVGEGDHALDALRYLVSMIDRRRKIGG